jgi:hypothetical protein
MDSSATRKKKPPPRKQSPPKPLPPSETTPLELSMFEMSKTLGEVSRRLTLDNDRLAYDLVSHCGVQAQLPRILKAREREKRLLADEKNVEGAGLDKHDLAILKVLAKVKSSMLYDDIGEALGSTHPVTRKSISARIKNLTALNFVITFPRKGAQITEAGRGYLTHN